MQRQVSVELATVQLPSVFDSLRLDALVEAFATDAG